MKTEVLDRNTLRFVFSLPADSVKTKILNKHFDYLTEKNTYGDTIIWFLKQPHPDTLALLFLWHNDTLENVEVNMNKAPKTRTRKDNPPKKEYLSCHSNIKSTIKPGEKFIIVSPHPVKTFISDSVLLVVGNDSVFNPSYKFLDTLHRKISVLFKVKEATNYRIFIPDSAIIDWNGIFNKKTDIVFRSKEAKEYGKLSLKVIPPATASYILQMLDEKEKVVCQRFLSHDTTFVFNYLDPAKYKFKLIFDSNGNKRWDTGNYLKNRI